MPSLYMPSPRAFEMLNITPVNGKPIRIMYSNRDPSSRKSGATNILTDASLPIELALSLLPLMGEARFLSGKNGINKTMTIFKSAIRPINFRITDWSQQVPESTRLLLRQIEAMQESAARREEAWAGVERTLNSRLQTDLQC